MAQVEQIDGGEIPALQKFNFQIGEKPSHHHPEIIADHHDGLHSPTVALTKSLDQLRVVLVPPGVEPLLELVEDNQHLRTACNTFPRRNAVSVSLRSRSPRNAGQRLRSPWSRRDSVSSEVAST